MARKSNNNDENLENMIFEDVSKPVKDNMEAGMEQAGSEPSVPEDFSFAEIGNDSEIGKSERSSIVGDPDSGEVFMPAEKVSSFVNITENEPVPEKTDNIEPEREEYNPVGDPFSKTDAVLAQEGSDLISELNEFNHETPDPNELPEPMDTAEFDAVVGSDGAPG